MMIFLVFYTHNELCTHQDEIHTTMSDFLPVFHGSLGDSSFKPHINFPIENDDSSPEHENKLFLFNVVPENPGRVVVRKLMILQVDL